MSIYICKPHETNYRAVLNCPNCKVRRRFVVSLQGWYGPMAFCCACGLTNNDGYYTVPPKTKREQAIREAKELWKAVTLTRKEAYQLDYEYAVGK